MPILRNAFDLPMLDLTSDQVSTTVCIAAIGPTTAAFLQETLHLRVNVVPPKPTPEELAGAINAAECDQLPRTPL
jgi:uroporphyrinogen-III synthase